MIWLLFIDPAIATLIGGGLAAVTGGGGGVAYLLHRSKLLEPTQTDLRSALGGVLRALQEDAAMPADKLSSGREELDTMLSRHNGTLESLPRGKKSLGQGIAQDAGTVINDLTGLITQREKLFEEEDAYKARALVGAYQEQQRACLKATRALMQKVGRLRRL